MAAAATQTPLRPAEDPGADSDTSIVTQDFTEQDVLDDIQKLRERKTYLGGRLSRPVKPFRKEDILLHPPEFVDPDDPDEPWRWAYLNTEIRYWRGEVRAWEAFLWQIQRKWQKRNDAAGGTVPPPPPLPEMDHFELYTDYLKLVRKMVESGGRQTHWHLDGGWHFGQYDILLDHFESVQRLVEDIRKERDLTDQPLPAEAEGARGPSGDASQLAGRSKRKREEEIELSDDAAADAEPAPKKSRKQTPSAPATNARTVRGGRTRISKAVDTSAEESKADGRRRGRRTAQATVKGKEKSAADLADPGQRGQDLKTSTGRARRSKVNVAATRSSRHSRRLAGSKPEYSGL